MKSNLIVLAMWFAGANLYAQGDTLWTKTYGGTDYDYGCSVQECASGGFIIAGETSPFPVGTDSGYVYLIRTNADGDTLWTKTYGGTRYDWGESVQECAGGGFIIAGMTSSFGAGGSWDIYLLRTNSDGDTLWTKTYGGTYDDCGWSVQECAEGGFIIAGWTKSFGAGGRDVYLIRTDTQGDTLWTKTYGGTGDDRGWSVQECTGGGFIITGYTTSFGDDDGDVYLIRADAQGDTLWTKTYGGTGSAWGRSVQECADGGFIIAGIIRSCDVWLIRISEAGVEEETGNRHKVIGISLEVYPNPCMGKAVIRCSCPFSVSEHEPRTRITIYDLSGKLVKHVLTTKSAGSDGQGVEINLEELTNGIYFVRVETNDYKATKKLTILR